MSEWFNFVDAIVGVLIGLIFVGLWIAVHSSFGSVEIVPTKDIDNPYALHFFVNPNDWLSNDYVVLKVRKKNH